MTNKKFFPFSLSPLLPRLNWADTVAGLSIAGLLLPESVAYSSIANLPIQMGIIALFVGLVCYALLGRSRFAIVSATSSSAAVLGAATIALGNGDVNIRVAFAVGMVGVAGLFFLVAGIARLGNITDFIAKPVLRGFTFGLAIVIILKQLVTIVGIPILPNHENSFSLIMKLISELPQWNFLGIALGAGGLVLLYVFSRFKYLPGGAIVIALGILLSRVLPLSDHGISLVGEINFHLSAPTIPPLAREGWLKMAELGLALAFVLYSESYGSIRTFALKHGDPTSPNRDLWVLGVSNMVSSLFRGMPVGAGYSATSANEASGATSRWAGLIAAGAILCIVLVLLPLIALTPHPILAAIVIHAVGHTLNPAILKPYFTWKRDRLLVIVAIIAVLVFGILNGLMIAIVLSVFMLLKRVSESSISIMGRLGQGHDFVKLGQYPDAKPVDGIVIFRPEEPLFFANSDRILSQMCQSITQAGTEIHSVVLSMEESYDIDSSSIESLLVFFDFMRNNHKRIILTRLKEPVYAILLQAIPPDSSTVYLSDLSVDEAVSKILSLEQANPSKSVKSEVPN